MKKKLYGFKPDVLTPEDYIFGASLPMEELQPDGDWSAYLPIRESQNLQNVEPYACVAFTILNCVEILIKRQYGVDRNYSDRFLAYVSGTKDKRGNSPKEVGDFLRKIGVVSQDLWPFDQEVKTFEKYYEPIPPKLYELAREFNEEWDFRYERVPENAVAISMALKCSPLLISVPAWYQRNGKYYRPSPAYQDNHATTMFQERAGEFRRVFDSYEPHIKDVEWNTVPMQVNRFWIKKRAVVEQQISIIKKLLIALGLLKEIRIKEEAILPPVVSQPQPVPVVSKYKWGTKAEVRHSVRVICDEEGLTLKEKNIITAVIQGESGFDTKVIRQNTDARRSKDYGLCQYNSYWYIEKGKLITKDQALNDPEFCVRLMIKRYRQGFLKDWVAYSSGAYKKYL